MSVSDVAARIQQLQGQFALLTGVNAPRAAVPTVTSPTAFADALSTAAAPGTATGAGPATAGVRTGGTRGTGAMPWTGPLAPAADTSTSRPVAGTTGQVVVDEARKYLGVPYVWGGTDPKRGLDCSGLVQLVYKNFGVELPRVSYMQAREGKAVPSLAQARPGDLLAFGSPSVNHIAIYIGDNKMIEAPRPGLQVRVSEVYTKPVAIRRVLPDSAPVARTAGGGATSLPSGVPFAGLFTAASAKYGVPATLLAAVAKQESGYDPQAVSPAGARGLMQIMPGTARGLGVNPDVPAQAVDGAARLLRDLIDEFDRVDLALAAYNAGPGAVHRYDGIPPYAETQRYVPAVLAIKRQLENA
jgi:cell wall-associated NlpC family hydrolase